MHVTTLAQCLAVQCLTQTCSCDEQVKWKNMFLQDRGGKGPVVTSIAAGGRGSAFLTRAPDEFPEPPSLQLFDKWATINPIAYNLIAYLSWAFHLAWATWVHSARTICYFSCSVVGRKIALLGSWLMRFSLIPAHVPMTNRPKPWQMERASHLDSRCAYNRLSFKP